MNIEFHAKSPILSTSRRGRRAINTTGTSTVCSVPANKHVLVMGSDWDNHKGRATKGSHVCVTLDYATVRKIVEQMREQGIEI